MTKSLVDRINDYGANKSVLSDLGLNELASAYGGQSRPNNDLAPNKYGLAAAYQTVIPVQASLDALSHAVWGLELQLKTYDDNGNETIIATNKDPRAKHEIFEAFTFARRTYGTPVLKALIYWHELLGEAYIEKVMNEYNTGKSIRVLNSLGVEPQDEFGQLRSYRYTWNGETYREFKANQIAAWVDWNPFDDNRGQGRVLSALDKVNIERNIARFLRDFFVNNARPGLVISPKNEKAAANMRHNATQIGNQLRKSHQGSGNQHKTEIMPFEADITQLDNPDLSSQYSIDEQISREIYAAFRVPPAMVGDTSVNPTYKDGDEVRVAFYINRVYPLADDCASYLNDTVLPFFDRNADVWLEFDKPLLDTVDQADLNRSQFAQTVYQSGIATLNEARIKAGLDPLEGDKGEMFITDVQQPEQKTETPSFGFLKGNDDKPPPPPTNNDNNETAKAAPPQTTFSEVTYNGVTVQASPVQSSDRDDKKYMRYVRYNNEERVVHWGQPGEDMERDNADARENFNSRHSCDTKKDPFAAGFWACWHWQPDTPLPGDSKSHADIIYNAPPNSYNPSDAKSELEAWYKFVENGTHQKRDFVPHSIPTHFVKAIEGAKAQDDRQAMYSAIGDALDVFEYDTIDNLKTLTVNLLTALRTSNDTQKTISGLEAQFAGRFNAVMRSIRNGEFDTRRRPGNILRQIIRVFGARAYRQGLQDGGVFDNPSDDDQQKINQLIQEQSQYVSKFTDTLMNKDGISDQQARDKATQWFNKSIRPFYQAGKLSADKNGLYEWKINPAKENCTDCQRLDSQRHRLHWWNKKGWLPKVSKLECGGYRCGCTLTPVAGKSRGQF